jgi:hypothetical protein
MTDFFRFPHTPHLAWLGEGSPRDDKVLLPNEVAALLAGNVVVEENWMAQISACRWITLPYPTGFCSLMSMTVVSGGSGARGDATVSRNRPV